MENQLKQVKEFQIAFAQGVKEYPDMVDLPKGILRHTLMQEENNEYLEAVKANDLVEVADALGDMLYILCGTIIEHGMQDIIEDVLTEIHRSNMSKLGANGEVIYRTDGKILKPEGYSKPDLRGIIRSSLVNAAISVTSFGEQGGGKKAISIRESIDKIYGHV